MKILSIYSEMPNQGLADVMKIVYKTFNELNVEIEEINLKDKIPFYEGIKIKEVTDIILKIQNVEACILATSVSMFAPTALMKAFLEHCSNPDYQAILMGKNYFTISISNTMGERETSEYLYRIINILGGSELGRIAIGGRDFNFINSDSTIKEAIEKNVEDFYRLTRQNRRIFISSEAYMYRNYYNDNSNSVAPISKPIYIQEEPVYSENTRIQPQQPQPMYDLGIDNTNQDFNEIKDLLDNIRSKAGDIEKNYSEPQFNIVKKENKVETYDAQFEAFAEKQHEDTKEITKLFSQNINENEISAKNTGTYSRPSISKPTEVVYREKTCKQMLQSLPHHFQSHLVGDLKSVFQFSITGDENFDCYISIENGETVFYEGNFEKADIFIYTNNNIMKDILRGKYSTQKAFMTGQLKVRGNFILLNKLDQLYKKMP